MKKIQPFLKSIFSIYSSTVLINENNLTFNIENGTPKNKTHTFFWVHSFFSFIRFFVVILVIVIDYMLFFSIYTINMRH